MATLLVEKRQNFEKTATSYFTTEILDYNCIFYTLFNGYTFTNWFTSYS